jgi:hypothetical protein
MPKNEECSHPIQNKSRAKVSIRKKKKQLNEQLYRIHLVCAAHWPSTWQIIQSTIDNNIRQQMEMHYDRLNRKLDRILQINRNIQHLHDRMETIINFTQE